MRFNNITLISKKRRDRNDLKSQSILTHKRYILGRSVITENFFVEHKEKKTGFDSSTDSRYPRGRYGKVKKIYTSNHDCFALKIETVPASKLYSVLLAHDIAITIARGMKIDAECWVRIDHYPFSPQGTIKLYTKMPWYNDGELFDDIKIKVEKNIEATRFLKLSVKKRFDAIDELFGQVAVIHQYGYAMNDISLENIMIHGESLKLIDLDSCRKINSPYIIGQKNYLLVDYSSKKNDAYALLKIVLHCFFDIFDLHKRGSNRVFDDKWYHPLLRKTSMNDLIISIKHNVAISSEFKGRLKNVVNSLLIAIHSNTCENDIDLSELMKNVKQNNKINLFHSNSNNKKYKKKVISTPNPNSAVYVPAPKPNSVVLRWASM